MKHHLAWILAFTSLLLLLCGCQKKIELTETIDPSEITDSTFKNSSDSDGSAKKEITIFIVGDSTAAEYDTEKTALTGIKGWGMCLDDYLEEEVTVVNYALSGRSTRTFLTTDYYSKLQSQLSKGDYLFIQFGHNDEGDDSEIYTDPTISLEAADENGKGANGNYSFAWMLYERYVKLAEEKEAIPVLLSPIARRQKTGAPTIRDHLPYQAAMQKLATEKKIAYIDMTQKTNDMWQEIFDSQGASGTAALHAVLQSDPSSSDTNHLSSLGAYTVAGLAVEGIKEAVPTLSKYLLETPRSY